MSPKTIVEEAAASGPNFGSEASRVLGELRAALAAVIATLPGRISSASALQRALNIDMKLGWKVFRIIDTEDPLALAHLVPGAGAMRLFLKAAVEQDVKSTLIDRAARAADEFEQLVDTHAGDRASFEAMISSWSADSRAKMDLNYKRAAFRSNSYFYGIQATAQLSCCLVHPSADESLIDVALLRGYMGLRRLRTSVPCVVAHVRATDAEGAPRALIREPLDPGGGTSHGVSLIRKFCSDPLPQFRTVEAEGGFVHGELIGEGVGNTAAVTCFTGDVTRKAGARYAGELDRDFGVCVMVRIPCTALILDLLVHEGTFGPFSPKLSVFGEHLEGAPFPSPTKERDRLELLESVLYLGQGLSVLPTREVPRYVELARFATDRLGWDADRFDVYRCRIEYPVMPSTVVLRFDLPEPR